MFDRARQPEEQVGALAESQLTLLEETITAVRALLHGETVNVDGRYVKLRDVSLVHPPTVVPPVISGVMKPKSLAISGRVADGTLLSEETTPESLRDALESIGATRPHEITVFTFAEVVAEWTPEAIQALGEAGAASVVVRPLGPDHNTQVTRLAATRPFG
jgi:alkanesulfonate monooxygenase SsuD/methylene tetrahydromethanopterin reductase-like flavin-dependent oxidoreductase (luciferase family)